LATQVLDFSGIRGEKRKFAQEMIGRGDQEAERTTILLLAMQMKRQAKWRWTTLGLAVATPLVAIVSPTLSPIK